ncbi:hypothetical protein VKT23_017995 [Stygiomarasmius scandens]|uniref:Cerato-platanin n=1 Tax=Marasmiellus scandens TaxID=2682957 RepID=A0ABR1IRU3_9AGAR
MKFPSVVLAIAFVLFPTNASSAEVNVQYDTNLDDPSLEVSRLACSDGKNGLITRYGFKNVGQIPAFPHIGGASVVSGWNSEQCGTCWKLTYTDANFKSKSIIILAVDRSADGFNIAKEAMDQLTGGHAAELGSIKVDATEVAVSECGL